MSHRHPTNRQELLEVFGKVGAQFERVRGTIQSRESAIKAALERVRMASQNDPLRKSGLPSTHPLWQVAAASALNIKAQLDEWVANVENYERGTQFHARYGDSLLIFVYGKVKAGKSSLGNYLAYGSSDPSDTLVATANPHPGFFLEADTGASEAMTHARMKQRQRFGVGVTETTSSIQGFTLPGLTWIDSPGIHSMTGVNGQLAEKYAGFADLVVFLSNSSSPGRRSDLEEISGLLHQGKPLVVLITASDFIDEDVDDAGQLVQQRVMKSKKDQHDQVSYVEHELQALAPQLRERLLDSCVYPVSVAYAEGGTKPEHWQDSGMAAFAARIASIADDQGLAIKRTTPLRNLMRFCEELDTSAGQFEGVLGKLRQQLEEGRAEMRRSGDHIVTTVRMELAKKVERLADLHAMDDAGFAVACRKEVDAILKQHAASLFKQLGQNLDQAMTKAQAAMPLDQSLPGFSKRTETRHYTSRTNEARGKAGGSSLLALTLGMLGSALGPIGIIAGTGCGAWLGSKMGSAVGRHFDSDASFEVEVGDNRQEVSLAARQQLVEGAECQIAALCQQLDALCFAATINWLQQFSLALSALRAEAQSQRTAIGKELVAQK